MDKLRKRLSAFKWKVIGATPPPWRAWLALHNPRFAASWGGPLNGQVGRRAIVRDLAHTVPVDRVVETGTFRGTSTEFFYAVFGCPVYTVEAAAQYYLYSRARLAHLSDVFLSWGDSRSFLRALAAGATETSSETVFVYLDAHWEDDLPLREELDIIVEGWSRAIVMIDDFEVPDDPGYRYDDYGPGKALVVGYLPESVRGWTVLYPSMPSGMESGARRGCCVLLSPALAAAAEDLKTLRAAD